MIEMIKPLRTGNAEKIDTERKKSKSATHKQRGLLSELGYTVEEGAASMQVMSALRVSDW